MRAQRRIAEFGLPALAFAAVAGLAALGVYLDRRDHAPPCDPVFRVFPYLTRPAPGGMTVTWLTHADAPGRLVYRARGVDHGGERVSAPIRATALAGPGDRPAPYRHRVALTGLHPATVYDYEVVQGEGRFASWFRAAPAPGSRSGVRFAAMADCETEPESTGKPAAWEDPTGRDPDRRYLLDQTQGLLGNLAIIRSQAFDFISISGDLVEDAGDQADWDEWWRWFATSDGDSTVAGRIPLLVAPGNHEYWAGPAGGGYEQPASERAIARYATYFERLGDGRPRSQQARAQAQTRAAGDASGGGADGESGGASPRYGRLDFGPVALLALDVTNDSPHRTARDTNYHLLGARDPGGGSAPSFQPGSAQYAWLEANLADAQATCAFTFVLLHHVPYSSGPHGWPPGVGPGLDEQSGVPVRALTALLVRYGVDAVLAGHDEMYERSEIAGQERLPDGTSRSHTLHVYDVGICGDGLRSPQRGLDNPRQRFVAHRDAPEVWRNGVLIEGGKHYGHLDVQVAAAGDGWRATLTPVYALPQLDEDGALIGVQRRIYDDVVILSAP